MKSAALCDWVFEHARSTPEAPAVDSPRIRVSYGALARRVLAVAARLSGLGVDAGDEVLVALPNTAATVVACLAVQHAGAISVEVARDWSPAELGVVFEQTRPRCAIVSARDVAKFVPLMRSRGVGGTARSASGTRRRAKKSSPSRCTRGPSPPSPSPPTAAASRAPARIGRSPSGSCRSLAKVPCPRA